MCNAGMSNAGRDGDAPRLARKFSWSMMGEPDVDVGLRGVLLLRLKQGRRINAQPAREMGKTGKKGKKKGVEATPFWAKI